MTKAAAILASALEEARHGLIRADSAGLSAATAAIGKAVAGLRDLTNATPAELKQIQRSIRRLEHLLEATRAFHEGLARLACLVDDAMANYTREGAPRIGPGSAPSVNIHG